MNFLKNIAEKAEKAAKSVADSPVRSLGRGSDDYYDSEENSVVVGATPSQEGFICPLCFTSFNQAETLQTHFQTSHSGGEIDIAQHSPVLENK